MWLYLIHPYLKWLGEIQSEFISGALLSWKKLLNSSKARPNVGRWSWGPATRISVHMRLFIRGYPWPPPQANFKKLG